MKRTFLEKIELYVPIIGAGLSAIIAILDLFDLLQSTVIFRRIPTITLLLVSIVIGILIIQYRKGIDTIQSAVVDLQLKSFQNLKEQINPRLKLVFGEHITELLINIQSAIKEQKIRLDDMELFRYFYKRTLEVYPKATFYATSIPSQKYFWKNKSSEQAIADFIANGGKMKRVFFLNSTVEAASIEEKEILNDQIEIGVEVYVTYSPNVPKRLKKFFLTEKEGQIAWEALIGPSREIIEVMATSNEDKTKEYVDIFDELLSLNSTRKVEQIEIIEQLPQTHK